MKLRLTIVALAIVAGGAERLSMTPALAQEPARPSPHEQLRRDLGAIFSDPAVDHGGWAATIHSLRHGETLYNLNSFRLQTPASVQKLLTTAAAAERLGWDFRYTTRIYATGPIDANGGLNGDLVVVSDGDPTI